MVRTLLVCILAAGLLAACATTAPVRKPEVEAKLVDANQALDGLTRETTQFYEDVEAVRQDIVVLYQHPGWPDMRVILEAEGDPKSKLDTVKATDAWSRKWQEPWEKILMDYLSLVKRCSALEARRITLESRIMETQAKFIGAAVMEYTAGNYNQGQTIYSVADILNNSAAELGSYTTNTLGLYDVDLSSK